MTRVLSGAVLIALPIAIVWFAPPVIFFAVAGAAARARVRRIHGARAGQRPAGARDVRQAAAAVMLTCAAFAREIAGVPLDTVLMSALVALGALTLTTWNGGRDALGVAVRQRSFRRSTWACRLAR